MNLHFIGSTRCVTGSCHMIQTQYGKLLVDCGMQQGVDEKGGVAEKGFAFDPAQIQFVLATHAHIDHTGLLPLLVKRGFTGKIISTGATAQLCAIMLPDSGHIQEYEAEWQNRKRIRQGKDPVPPIYTAEDAKECLKYFQPVDYGETLELAPGISVRFTDAGHMLGSAQIEVWVTEEGRTTKVLFSGDLGHRDRPIVCDPQAASDADYVVMEGTYGDKLHKQFIDGTEEMIGVITSTFARGGNVVIPAFAVGRTQELLFMLHKLFKQGRLDGARTPVCVDSPLGIEATKVFERVGKEYFDEETRAIISRGENPLSFPSLQVASTADESRLINEDKASKVIISARGMCEAGRIRHHLKHNLWRVESTILFSGYQAVGTLGRTLLDGAKKVKLFGEDIAVNARVEKLEGFSAHADKAELADWLGGLSGKPKKVFLVHGEEDVLLRFGQELTGMGYDVAIPFADEKFDTSAGETRVPLRRRESDRGATRSAGVSTDELYRQAARITALLERAGTGNELLGRVLSEDLQSFADKWERLLK